MGHPVRCRHAAVATGGVRRCGAWSVRCGPYHVAGRTEAEPTRRVPAIRAEGAVAQGHGWLRKTVHVEHAACARRVPRCPSDPHRADGGGVTSAKMYGPDIIARTLSVEAPTDKKYGNSWQYHPRSDR